MERCLLQECSLCGSEYPIHKCFHSEKDNTNYIEYNGKQFLCCKCKEEKDFNPHIAERQPVALYPT